MSFGTFGSLWHTLRLVQCWYTKCVGSRLLVHQAAFWHIRIVLGHFGYDWYSRYVWYTSNILVH